MMDAILIGSKNIFFGNNLLAGGGFVSFSEDVSSEIVFSTTVLDTNLLAGGGLVSSSEDVSTQIVIFNTVLNTNRAGGGLISSFAMRTLS